MNKSEAEKLVQREIKMRDGRKKPISPRPSGNPQREDKTSSQHKEYQSFKKLAGPES
jgi:hypothetical protein